MSDIAKRVNLLVDLGAISTEDGVFVLDFIQKTTPKAPQSPRSFRPGVVIHFLDNARLGLKLTAAELLEHLTMDPVKVKTVSNMMMRHHRVHHIDGEKRDGSYLYTIVGDLPGAVG